LLEKSDNVKKNSQSILKVVDVVQTVPLIRAKQLFPLLYKRVDADELNNVIKSLLKKTFFEKLSV